MERTSNSLKQFDIAFSGLKVGLHEYQFTIGRLFFESLESDVVDDAELVLTVQLEKQENLLTLHFEVNGTITGPCGRCTQPVNIPVQFNERLFVKFGEETFETEEILTLPEHAHTINIAEIVLELITVHLPIVIFHEDESDCDPAYLEYLSGEAEDNQTEELSDPRWEALKKLKND